MTGTLVTADTRVDLAPAVASHHGEIAPAAAVGAGAGAAITDALARSSAVDQPINTAHVHPRLRCENAVGEKVPSEWSARHDPVQSRNSHHDRALDIFRPHDVLPIQGKPHFVFQCRHVG